MSLVQVMDVSVLSFELTLLRLQILDPDPLLLTAFRGRHLVAVKMVVALGYGVFIVRSISRGWLGCLFSLARWFQIMTSALSTAELG